MEKPLDDDVTLSSLLFTWSAKMVFKVTLVMISVRLKLIMRLTTAKRLN